MVVNRAVRRTIHKQKWMWSWARSTLADALFLYEIVNVILDEFQSGYLNFTAMDVHMDLYTLGNMLGRVAKFVA